MKYLLDTNIISEFYKPKPHPIIEMWLKQQDLLNIYLSAITIGEIRYGVEKKRLQFGNSPSVDRFMGSLTHMESVYSGRIWPFDQNAAQAWGKIAVLCPNKPLDTQIASIALANSAVLVSRDKDFTDLALKTEGVGIVLPLLNPFE